eukprot:scaffold120575_cov16-Tisochrysis_lutea.AAC.1
MMCRVGSWTMSEQLFKMNEVVGVQMRAASFHMRMAWMMAWMNGIIGRMAWMNGMDECVLKKVFGSTLVSLL